MYSVAARAAKESQYNGSRQIINIAQSKALSPDKLRNGARVGCVPDKEQINPQIRLNDLLNR